MAEAQSSDVLTQHSLFYCHKCTTDIVPQLPDYVCPRCHNGFIEPSGGLSSSSSSSSSDAGTSGRSGFPHNGLDPDSDDTHSAGSSFDAMDEFEANFAPLGNFLIGAGLNPFFLGGSANDGDEDGDSMSSSTAGPSSAGSGADSSSGDTGSSAGGRRSGSSGRNTRGLSALFMGPPNRRNRLRGPQRGQVLRPMLQELMVHFSTGGAPMGVPLFSEEMAGHPGDYVWGRGGLDAVITHLMTQMDNSGPPPMTEEQITAIPSVQVTQEQCNNNAQCSVCMEDFSLQEPVKKLHCDHCFHEPCITPWLKMHATCPVCRKTLNDRPASSGSAAASTQPTASRLVFSPSTSGPRTIIFSSAHGPRTRSVPSRDGPPQPSHSFTASAAAPSPSGSRRTTREPRETDPGGADARMTEEDLD